MDMYYWTGFSKRENSTKKPSDTGTKVEILLKEDTSIDAPSIVLTGNATNINYCYIPDFEKYYFVNSPVILANGMTQYDLVEDTLATHKTEIGNTVAQIAYSSTGYDIWKVDTRIAAKTTKTITHAADTPGAFDPTGCYIVSIVNVDSRSSAVCYYAMDQGNLRDLIDKICTDQTLQQSIQSYCSDAFDALISCIWVPISKDEIPGSNETIVVGNDVLTGITGIRISNPPIRATSVTVSIPWTYNDFRRNAPYSSLCAWVPGYGYIDLNTNDLVKETSLKFDFKVDCMTGDCSCQIIDAVDSSIIYQTVSYNIGISIPLSRYTMDVGGIINATTGLVGSATDTVIAGGLLNPAGFISGIISTIGSGVSLAVAANKREISTKGGMGGRATIAQGIDVEVLCFSVDTEDPDAASYVAAWGRPVGITHAISNHSGYVKCDAASASIAGDSFERESVNGFLNSGFFYE